MRSFPWGKILTRTVIGVVDMYPIALAYVGSFTKAVIHGYGCPCGLDRKVLTSRVGPNRVKPAFQFTYFPFVPSSPGQTKTKITCSPLSIGTFRK